MSSEDAVNSALVDGWTWRVESSPAVQTLQRCLWRCFVLQTWGDIDNSDAGLPGHSAAP